MVKAIVRSFERLDELLDRAPKGRDSGQGG
jgi:hypothetical protein